MRTLTPAKFGFLVLVTVLAACTQWQPPRYVKKNYDSNFSGKARFVLERIIGPDDMRVRYTDSIVDLACNGNPEALTALHKISEDVDGEHAEVQTYDLALVFFSLGDAHFSESLRFASTRSREFAARHLVPIFDRYEVDYPATRKALELYAKA